VDLHTFVAKVLQESMYVSRETAFTVITAMDHLRLQCAAWGLELDSVKLSSLGLYADLLAGYSLANVMGTKDRDQIILGHLLDSLSCTAVAPTWSARSIVDVGAGGGLPGVPLSIVRPNASITLLEATEKKVRFLQHIKTELELQNLLILHARAEEIGRDPAYRETFDLATARALAALGVVIEYCAPLLNRDGYIISMKGKLSEEELSGAVAASAVLQVEVERVQRVDYQPQFSPKYRHLVILRKVGVTPKDFPRKVGLAKKRPLGK